MKKDQIIKYQKEILALDKLRETGGIKNELAADVAMAIATNLIEDILNSKTLAMTVSNFIMGLSYFLCAGAFGVAVYRGGISNWYEFAAAIIFLLPWFVGVSFYVASLFVNEEN